MDFLVAIGLYVALLLILLWVTWSMQINLFSAATLSFLVAGIFLALLIPPTDIDRYTNDLVDGYCDDETNHTAVALVISIYILTIVLTLWYVLDSAFYNRYEANSECGFWDI